MFTRVTIVPAECTKKIYSAFDRTTRFKEKLIVQIADVVLHG